jgi:putative oxidoreductase
MITVDSLGPTYSTTLNVVLLIVRLFLGPMIFAHGYAKFFRGGKIKGTAGWFDSIGMKPGLLNAYLAAGTEMAVGVLLAVGFLTTLACAGLVALMLVAILTVHRKNGFFIINKGGGIEYCLAISVMALAQGTLGGGRFSIDHAANVLHWTNTTNFTVVLVVGVLGALLQLAVFFRPPRVTQG